MKTTRFTDEQIIGFLKQAEAGMSIKPMCVAGLAIIHDLLRPEFPHVNHKRVYRLCRDANLAVRRRKKGKRPLNERVPLQLAQTVNEVWCEAYLDPTRTPHAERLH
jgi:hypothetical protein